jgi:hypothetical protein
MNICFSEPRELLHRSRTAELLVQRWTADRPYFAVSAKRHGAWLQASWQLASDHATLMLHWSRLAADQQRSASQNSTACPASSVPR